MKNFLINSLILLLFLGGLGVLLYPTVSNMINERNQSKVITRYEESIDLMAEEERAAALQAAHDYNANLHSLVAQQDSESIEASALYNETLNIGGSGVMGSLSIDKIRVNLPIYHGTSEEVLQVAVGHLPATSLPVGGESTHAVLSAHTGLPSAKLFTDLDQLEEGDVFTITVLNEMLVYEVDQILVVEPEDTAELRAVEGEDYVTLVTCTPYGINSHRLLVRGTRIFLTEEEAADLFIETDAVFLDKTLLIPLAVFPVVIIYFFWVAVKTGDKSKNKQKVRRDDS